MALWDTLPRDILDQVVERLTQHIDVLHFGQVCNSWRYCALQNWTRLPLRLPLGFFLHQETINPLLMLPSGDGSEYCSFFNVSQQEHVGEFNLPETRGRWLCASSFGWVLMVDLVKNPEDLILFNPVSRVQLQLPPLSTFPLHQYQRPDYFDLPRDVSFLKKAVLSVDPSKNPDNWVLMAIVACHQRLCFCRPGDDKWTLIGGDPMEIDPPLPLRLIKDVIYWKGKFYAVNGYGIVSSCDVNSTAVWPPKLEILIGAPAEAFPDTLKYLAISSGGKLLQIERKFDVINLRNDITCYNTTDFTVYRFVEEKHTWKLLETLKSDILFLGRNASLCFSGDVLPNFRKGCIYFTDDSYLTYESPPNMKVWTRECHDSGIYDYEGDEIEAFNLENASVLMPPVWITLNPW